MPLRCGGTKKASDWGSQRGDRFQNALGRCRSTCCPSILASQVPSHIDVCVNIHTYQYESIRLQCWISSYFLRRHTSDDRTFSLLLDLPRVSESFVLWILVPSIRPSVKQGFYRRRRHPWARPGLSGQPQRVVGQTDRPLWWSAQGQLFMWT